MLMGRRMARRAGRRAARRTARRRAVVAPRARVVPGVRRRRPLAGILALAGTAAVAYKLGKNKTQEIEQHTGRPVDTLSDEELAAAMDRLQEAERRLAKAEKTAARTRRNVEELKLQIDTATADSADPEILQALSDRLNLAEQDAEQAFRKAAKNKAKADDAADTVTQLGGSIEEKE